MTQPPYPPDYHPPSSKRFARDRAAASRLATFLLVACGLGFLYSMFAGMATDVCSGTDRCSNGLIGAAYLVAWGGIAAAVLVTLVGMGKAATKHRGMIVWPRLGWAIFLVTYVGGGFLLNAGVGG